MLKSIIIYSCLLLCSAIQALENTNHRIVVIGDLHADIGLAREVFRLAGGTDENDAWVGGSLVIVQLGDLIGRSYEEREVLDFILAVQDKAEAAGGKLHILLGNHEVFGARLDFSWVDERSFAAYKGIPGLKLDDPRLQHLPVNQRARGAALMPGGHYARKMAGFSTVLKLGDTIFVHGSVTPYWAEYGINRINEEVSEWFAGDSEESYSSMGYDRRNNDRVMWNRQFSQHVSEDDCRDLEKSLSILGAKRMIVAHTVHESITARCNERVWAIDVGMSRAYQGSMQVLEIIDDEMISVIKP